MADFESIVPRNPVELAKPHALNLVFQKSFDEFDNAPIEHHTLKVLDESAEDLELYGDHRVNTGLAFVIPIALERNEQDEGTIHRFSGETEFVGTFRSHSTVKVGKFVGEQTVRAVCLVFEDVLVVHRKLRSNEIITLFRKLDEEDLMHVPVFAVNGIERAA